MCPQTNEYQLLHTLMFNKFILYETADLFRICIRNIITEKEKKRLNLNLNSIIVNQSQYFTILYAHIYFKAQFYINVKGGFVSKVLYENVISFCFI